MSGPELVLWGLVGGLSLLAFGVALLEAVAAAERRARALERGDDPGEVQP